MQSEAQLAQIEVARSLLTALEQGNDTAAKQALATLSESRETELFKEVGKLTRELHDALNNFKIDNRLVDLTQNDMPDTRDRLNFVINTTEEAAHQTLSYIENTLPLANELQQTAAKLNESWLRFRSREMDAEQFRSLSREIEAYLPTVSQHSEKIHENLSEMTQIQGFQDLTGQVLKQVISLLEEVESNLVRLVKLAGVQKMASPHKEINPLKAEGPQINAKNKTNVVNNQNEVDDLLSSLGF